MSSNGFSPSERSRVDNPLSTRVIAAASEMKSSPGKNSSTNLHVGFSEEKVEVKEKRERFLTAKYGVSLFIAGAINILGISNLIFTFFVLTNRLIRWPSLERG